VSKKVVASIILENDNSEVLMGKRLDEKWKDYYCFPGGKVEEHETVKIAGIREVREETGLIIAAYDLHFVGYTEPDYAVCMFFWCFNWLGNPENLEPAKCQGWQWKNIARWPTFVVPGIQLFKETVWDHFIKMRVNNGFRI